MINADFFRKRAGELIPYIATLYYFEIIYFMFMANFIFGKIAATLSGFALGIFLSCHIVALFNMKNLNRKVQLFLMDVHFAYSAGFILSRIFSDMNLSGIDIAVTAFRVGIAILELPMIIILTDEFIIKRYR